MCINKDKYSILMTQNRMEKKKKKKKKSSFFKMSGSKNRLDENKEREKIPNSFRGYKVLKETGNIAFARVFKVEDDVTKEIYAAKVNPKKKFNKFEETEIEILQHITHPYIIKMYEVFEIATSNNDEYIVIIMEYCENDSLYDYIQKNNGFKKKKNKKKEKCFAQF